jgi:PAS domain S-box-containing protein
VKSNREIVIKIPDKDGVYMKIIEVSKSYSLRTLLESYFSYIEYDLMIFTSLSSEIIRQQQSLDFHDFGFIVFVDFEHESYIKYVTLKQAIGFTDEQVIWITTAELNENELINSVSTLADKKHFEKINRILLHAKDEKNILLSMMKRFHYYNERRLSKSIQETIQKMMKSMLGFLGEGILILDSDKNIIFMNIVAEEISGYTELEGLNKPFLDIFPMYNAYTKEPISDVMKELSIENPSIGLPYNTMVIDRSNQERYISANVSFLYKSLLKGYFIILRDISRIVHTENSFRRISKAVEYSPTSVIIFGTDAIIDYVNPAFETLTGYRFDEIVGKSFEVLLSEDTSREQYMTIWNTIINGNLWDGTLHNRKKAGDTFWEKVHIGPIFNEQEEIDRFVAINQDITHEVEMSNQIINERNNFYALINLAPIGLMLFKDDSTFSNINKRAQSIIENMGITAETLLEFQEINTQETMLSCLQRVHKNKQTFLQKEFMHSGFESKEAYIRLGAVPFTLGTSESVLIAIDDVTLNKLIEKQLEIARDEAKEADKAKSMFLANMSHEIRTPINGIIGMTDITLANKLLCKEDEENLKLVKVSSKNLLQIINDILDISKLDAGKIDFEEIPFNVETIVITTLKLFEVKAEEKELYLKMHIEDSGKKILIGDPYRLQQCITNLVNNAIKFTEIGGVEITVKTHALSGIDSMVALDIEVKDTGIGIGESERKALFKRFSQVDSSITRQYGGTGLGLAITKTLVLMQQGHIDLESEKGKGSKFIISIPYKLSQTNEIVEMNDVAVVAQEQLIQQILIVEDEKINQLIIKKYLSQSTHTIDVASDGLEAIAFASKKKYDIIFMDIQLPGMSGIEVMKEIRIHLCGI